MTWPFVGQTQFSLLAFCILAFVAKGGFDVGDLADERGTLST